MITLHQPSVRGHFSLYFVVSSPILTLVIEGVAEGRLIFANLKRSIQYAQPSVNSHFSYCVHRYTISHSTPEVIPQLLCNTSR